MELKLNTYKKENGKKVIDKVFATNTLDLSFGVIEDFIKKVDLSNLDFKNKTNEELSNTLFSLILNCISSVKPLLLDVFEDITEDDIRNAKTSEIVNVIMSILMYSISEIFSGLTSKKK